MNSKRPLGLFVTGTDTNVGKTIVAVTIIRFLRRAGFRVGAYKPIATGCYRSGTEVMSSDADLLWEATGKLGTYDRVCPQRFLPPLAPYLAAQQVGQKINRELLHDGLNAWRSDCDFVVVEGVGGIMSPICETLYVSDLIRTFGFPAVVVAANRIGVMNQVLQSSVVASTFQLKIAAVVLNSPVGPVADQDPSIASNHDALQSHCHHLTTTLAWNASEFVPEIDWQREATELS